jgi:hypothetical protein
MFKVDRHVVLKLVEISDLPNLLISSANQMIPYHISINNNNISEVSWINIGLSKIDKPMFDQFIEEAIAKSIPENPISATSTAELLSFAANFHEILPAGLIFHVSRCGSTLLSNSLQQIEGSVVISEAGILNTLFKLYYTDSETKQFSKYQLKQLIQAVVTIIGNSQLDCRQLFIKFSSWNIFLISFIREIWPKVPIVFAFRNPNQVLESLLNSRPGWSNLFQNLEIISSILKIDQKQVDQWSYIDFIMNFLSGYYKAGNSLSKESLFIHYGSNKEAQVKMMLNHFKIKATEKEWQAIYSGLQIYSKDPKQTSIFNQTSVAPAFLLNQRLKELVELKLLDDYLKLKSLALKQTKNLKQGSGNRNYF